MKASKIFFIFIVLSIGLYFVSVGVLGQNGLLYNRTLEKLLTQKKYQEDKIGVELNSLIQRQIELASDQGLKDAAVSLGYYTEDDKVYMFSEDSIQDAVFVGNTWDTEVKLFNPVSKIICFFIAVFSSAFLTFIYWFIWYLRSRDYVKSDSNYDNFDLDDFRT